MRRVPCCLSVVWRLLDTLTVVRVPMPPFALLNPTLARSRSVVPSMEDFDPALFMTVVHSTASFTDIRNGLESLDGAKANQVCRLSVMSRGGVKALSRAMFGRGHRTKVPQVLGSVRCHTRFTIVVG